MTMRRQTWDSSRDSYAETVVSLLGNVADIDWRYHSGICGACRRVMMTCKRQRSIAVVEEDNQNLCNCC